MKEVSLSFSNYWIEEDRELFAMIEFLSAHFSKLSTVDDRLIKIIAFDEHSSGLHISYRLYNMVKQTWFRDSEKSSKFYMKMILIAQENILINFEFILAYFFKDSSKNSFNESLHHEFCQSLIRIDPYFFNQVKSFKFNPKISIKKNLKVKLVECKAND